MEASAHRQAIVDGAGDLTRALKALDPALEGLQEMRNLFGALVGAEMAATHAGKAVSDAEDAIAAAAARLLAALDRTGAALPLEVRALAADLWAKLQGAAFSDCVPA